jgi:hypothetical protein
VHDAFGYWRAVEADDDRTRAHGVFNATPVSIARNSACARKYRGIYAVPSEEMPVPYAFRGT